MHNASISPDAPGLWGEVIAIARTDDPNPTLLQNDIRRMHRNQTVQLDDEICNPVSVNIALDQRAVSRHILHIMQLPGYVAKSSSADPDEGIIDESAIRARGVYPNEINHIRAACEVGDAINSPGGRRVREHLEDEPVCPAVPGHHIRAVAALDAVVAQTAKDRAIARPAKQRVIASDATQHIVQVGGKSAIHLQGLEPRGVDDRCPGHRHQNLSMNGHVHVKRIRDPRDRQNVNAHPAHKGGHILRTRGKWRTVEVLACEVTWRPHPEQIASARRGYDDWWQALDWVRDGLIVDGMLRDREVTAAMPKTGPWEQSLAYSS